jgi:hypothetical protein
MLSGLLVRCERDAIMGDLGCELGLATNLFTLLQHGWPLVGEVSGRELSSDMLLVH